MLKKLITASVLGLFFVAGCGKNRQELWEYGNFSSLREEQELFDKYFTEKEKRELPYRTKLFYLRLISDEAKRYQVDKEKQKEDEKKAREECQKAFREYKNKEKSLGLIDSPSCLFF